MADDLFFSYGIGVAESQIYEVAETKILDIGLRRSILDGFYWNLEGGLWVDSSGDPTRNGSTFLSTGPGFLVDLNPIEIRNAYGISYISSPDAYLGGSFPQFHGEFYIGARDKSGNGIGFKYSHFSSAGIEQPNIGRDFIILELSSHL